MNSKNGNRTAAVAAAGGVSAGSPPAVKEKIFSLIRKASEEGISDGMRTLWIDFTPHIAVEEKEDSYVIWLWRGCITIKIILDREFNVLGFGVERP